MCNRIKWNEVLSTNLGLGVMTQFAFEGYSGEKVKEIFVVNGNSRVSGQVRRLIRDRGVINARNVARKAVRRYLEKF